MATVMKPLEFLYNFLTIEEFNKIREQWSECEYKPQMIISFTKIEIWLL